MVLRGDSASDLQLLRQKLVDMTASVGRASATISTLAAEKKILTHERDAAIAQRDGALQENEKLLLILSQFQRTLFGRRSEKIDPDQLALLLTDNELAPANVAANENTPAPEPGAAGSDDKPEKPRPRRNRGQLPPHLPRIEVVVDIANKTCRCCGGNLHKIGESRKEMLDVVPIQYRVKRIIRPRYGCRACENAVVQAPAPAQPIDGGMATEAFLAHIAMMKYGFHMPLYRLEQMFAAQGIALDRSTLALWMGRAAWWLKPLHELLLATVLTYPKLFADETPLPMLDPGRGKTKRCQFWAVAMDDRPWAGPAPPAVVYVFAEDRKGKRAKEIFAGFSGVLQVDGYAGYNALVRLGRAGGPVTLAFCFAHARRKFYDVHVATGSTIAAEALARISRFYAIEARIRGRSAAERRAVRQAETKPLVDDFKLWLEARLMEISRKSGLAKAIRYALALWEGLTRFLDDGRIEIDSNTVERSMRSIGLGRKNHLFAGSPRGAETWAILASLINSCKLNEIDPQAYLTDVLERVVSGRTTINRLDELLPWAWKAAHQGAEAKVAA
jgi:transposase